MTILTREAVRVAMPFHTFRATGIMAHLKNGGTLERIEKVVAMANHASTRTTQFYDYQRDELSLNEVE